jgi:replicative DNA helicase
LNIASALLKQIITLQDYDTWSAIRKNYLPIELHDVFSVIDKHCSTFHSLPTFEDLEFGVRDNPTKQRVELIKSIEVDTDAFMLLEYLKNEYTQNEILSSLETFVDSSIAFETAEEAVGHLHQIVLDVETKVDLKPAQESMQRLNLFDPEEDLARFIKLGLNSEYDSQVALKPTDLILIGGKRGAGKSIVSANIANNIYNSGKSVIYFTIEMTARETLQRIAAIGAGVSSSKISHRSLSVGEWESVARWWAKRFIGSEAILAEYFKERNFDNFHQKLTSTLPLKEDNQIHIVYDPTLTLSKIKAEIDKKVATANLGLIVVDYVNQVKRSLSVAKAGQFDWTEQIEVSKALKQMAQDYEVPVVSPYQIDETGQARFARGILDAADAAFVLNAHSKEDACIELKCTKMRSNPEIDFISRMDWSTLKIGPDSAEIKQKDTKSTGEGSSDDPF